MSKTITDQLKGGDLRSIGKANQLLSSIRNQADFDALFANLYATDRIVVMRAADVIEKVTLSQPDYLQKHKAALLSLSKTAVNIELKWHLALLLPRLSLNKGELKQAWIILSNWASNKKESKIVRVNSLQALFALSQQGQVLQSNFAEILNQLSAENIPSLNARIRQIKNAKR